MFESRESILKSYDFIDKLFLRLPILLNHYADIAPGVERVVLVFDLVDVSQSAETGNVFVFSLGEAFLQPVDVGEEALLREVP